MKKDNFFNLPSILIRYDDVVTDEDFAFRKNEEKEI